MFQLIIVDDEIPAVKGIKSGIDWERLGINGVFTAFNIRQAKDIFLTHTIDIMLCDIEMPQGNGLELLSWIRENYPETESIFLTCHAEFSYAKRALQLGSMDYILKPVPFAELEIVITKAIEKIKMSSRMAEYSKLGQFWHNSRPLLIERFWLDILNQTIPSRPDEIRKAAVARNIPVAEQMKFVPVLISLQRWNEVLTLHEEKIMEFALKNVAEELILKEEANGLLIHIRKGCLLGILYFINDVRADIELIEKDCKAYIAACNKYLHCDLSCYIGDEIDIHELTDVVVQLSVRDENNVAFSNKVFLGSRDTVILNTIHMPDMNLWAVMLNEGAKDKVLAEVDVYLRDLANQSELNANTLYQFYQDFLQMVFSVLKQRGIQAHQLFSDDKSRGLLLQAARAVTDMLVWTKYIVERAMDYISEVEKSESIVAKVKKFMAMHLSEELTREDIAFTVYLNTDYLNRIFKKETGMPILEYLYRERMKVAQELLAKTDMPISAVASHVGYSNFAYFSRMFRKNAGMNPVDYRQKCLIGKLCE